MSNQEQKTEWVGEDGIFEEFFGECPKDRD